MKSSLRKTRLLATGLLVLIVLNSCTLLTSTTPTTPSSTATISQTFIPIPAQEGWKTIKIIATEAQPVQKNNPTNKWVQSLLSDSLHFSNGLQVKLDMQSNGANGILLIANPLGEPWWKGHKRLEILYEMGFLNVILRDGSQEAPVYLSQVQLGPGNNEVTILFDQEAKNIEVQHSNRIVMQISTRTVGDFPNGLFPMGWIIEVDLINGPDSGCTLNKLEFLVPASDDPSPVQ